MKCPVCGRETITLSTRHNENTNTTYRRKQCSVGHRFTSVESVAAVGAKRAPKRPVVAVPKSRRASPGVPAQAGKPAKQTRA